MTLRLILMVAQLLVVPIVGQVKKKELPDQERHKHAALWVDRGHSKAKKSKHPKNFFLKLNILRYRLDETVQSNSLYDIEEKPMIWSCDLDGS